MDYRIAFEWDERNGILLSKMYSFRDAIEIFFKERNYGGSINRISVVMTCMAKDFKQRKRYKKDVGRFEYDILLDYYMIKNVEAEQKRAIIRKQLIDITEQTFSKYKFEDFDKNAFLSDFTEIVSNAVW